MTSSDSTPFGLLQFSLCLCNDKDVDAATDDTQADYAELQPELAAMHDLCLSERWSDATTSKPPRPTTLTRLRHQLSLFRHKDGTKQNAKSERYGTLSRLNPFVRRRRKLTPDSDYTATTIVPSTQPAATSTSFSTGLTTHSTVPQAKPRRASIAIDLEHSSQVFAQSSSFPKVQTPSRPRTSKRDVEREEFASMTSEQGSPTEVLISTREFWHHRDTECCTGPPQVWHRTLQSFESSPISVGPSVLQEAHTNVKSPERAHDKRRRVKHTHAPKRRGNSHSNTATVGSRSETSTLLQRSRASDRNLVGVDEHARPMCVNGHPPDVLSPDLRKSKGGHDHTHSFDRVGGRLQDRTRPVAEGDCRSPRAGYHSADESAHFQDGSRGHMSHAPCSLSRVPSPPRDSRAESASTRDDNSSDSIRRDYNIRGTRIVSRIVPPNGVPRASNMVQPSSNGKSSPLPSFRAAKSRAWNCISSNLARLGMAQRFLDPWPGDRKRRLPSALSKVSETVADRFSFGKNGVSDDDFFVDDFA